MPDPRRDTPRTDQILADPRLREARDRLGARLVKEAVAAAQQRCRAGEIGPADVADEAVAALPARATTLRRVVNATGVLVHTNLGRAPLSRAAVDAVSTAAGDPYCAAHNAENAAHLGGVPTAKVEALSQFRASPLFTPAERAALELATAAGACPPCVTDAHFSELRKHYSEDAATEIVAVLALLGWLNRWNVTLATRLEDEALAFAMKHLAPSGWTPGIHADTMPGSTK